ncbi:hypothetical protein BGX26_001625 [Mortierella sp. AD094]|nr:hypothetical protein BGX26_001625 [Mortierella sp. AD094]
MSVIVPTENHHEFKTKDELEAFMSNYARDRGFLVRRTNARVVGEQHVSWVYYCAQSDLLAWAARDVSVGPAQYPTACPFQANATFAARDSVSGHPWKLDLVNLNHSGHNMLTLHEYTRAVRYYNNNNPGPSFLDHVPVRGPAGPNTSSGRPRLYSPPPPPVSTQSNEQLIELDTLILNLNQPNQ